MTEKKNEVVTMSDIQERLRERIKLAFLDLIPDAKWDELIKNETERMVRDSPAEYGREAQPSVLRQLVRDAVGDVWKQRLTQWQKTHDHIVSFEQMDETFKDLVHQAASEYSISIGKQIVAHALQAMRSELGELGIITVCSCGRVVTKNSTCPGCGRYNS